MLTASGGACDIIADLASAQELEIPAFAERTADAIAEHLRPFATARNPLDVTGGARPADLDAVAEAIAGLAATALSLGNALRAVEVNPMWVDGDQVEALDVLVVTDAEQGSGTEPGR